MTGMSSSEFLRLLAREASPVEFERPLLDARAAGADAETLTQLEQAKATALQVRALLEARRRRESELSALYATAVDLASYTDVDEVLQAIVRRARELLASDVAYLSLIDEEEQDTYMRVTEGANSPEFRAVRLPMGAGLGGLVAQTATPYSTPSYFEDPRFHHTGSIDSAVKDEGLTSITGVPLLLGKRVIGVLYAANRDARGFSKDDVSLLVSLAAHASIAIDNARLLSETQVALRELEDTSAQLRQRTRDVERAADAHDRLTRVVLHGGGVDNVVLDLRDVLGGDVTMLDEGGRVLATTDEAGADDETLRTAALEAHGTVEEEGVAATPVSAGADHLGVLLLRRDEPLTPGDRRILERAALVTALLLLFRSSVAEAESRVRGELLEDLLADSLRDPDALQERARLLGADLDAPHVVVVASPDGDRPRAARAAAHVAGVQGGFSAVRDGHVVLVLPGESPEAAGTLVNDGLGAALQHPVTAGAAGPARGPQALRAAYDEATRCLTALLAMGRRHEIATADRLGFVGLLLGTQGDVGAFVQQTLGDIRAYDDARGTDLVGTLTTWFAADRNLTRTSQELHVHVNTVTQRLERITKLLGEDWQQPGRLLELQLALRLAALQP